MATNLPSCFFIQLLEQLLKFLVNFTLLKYVKSKRSYGFLITKELIFGFQILNLKDYFSASLNSSNRVINDWNNLPNKLMNSHDLDDFEKEYDKWTKEIYKKHSGLYRLLFIAYFCPIYHCYYIIIIIMSHNNPQPDVVFAEPDLRSGSLLPRYPT